MLISIYSNFTQSQPSQGKFIYIARYQTICIVYCIRHRLSFALSSDKKQLQSLSVLVISFGVQSHARHHFGKCLDDIQHVTVNMHYYHMMLTALEENTFVVTRILFI